MADSDVLRQFVHLHHNVATIHLLEGRHAAATRCLREAARCGPRDASEALASVARSAVQAGGEAYRAEDMATAVACVCDALDASPKLNAVQEFSRAVAAQMHNVGASAFNKGDFIAAAEALWTAHQLDPQLSRPAEALLPALRRTAAICFADGRALEALQTIDRLLGFATGAPQDAALFGSVGSWLRENFAAQVSTFKVGAAVLLLQHLARLDGAALTEPAMSQATAALTELLAQHASEQPVEVLTAVISLDPLCPSARLSWAGAAAYTQAMSEARRLHVSGALLESVTLCEPAIRYRAHGPDRQLPHVLASLLCKRVEETLEPDRGGALVLHARALDLLEAYRSQGLSSSSVS